MNRRVVAVILVALVVGAAWLASTLGWRYLNGYLRDQVAAALGPGKYDVDLSASWLDLARMRVPGLTIRGEHVRLEGRPELEALEIQVKDLQMSGNQIVALGALHFSVSVTQDALNAWLPGRPKRGDHEPVEQVTLSDGRIEARFELRKGAFSPPVAGKLEAKGPLLELTLEMNRLGAVLPERVKRSVEHRTLVDLTDNPLNAEIEQVRVLSGRMMVDGAAHPKLPLSLERPAH